MKNSIYILSAILATACSSGLYVGNKPYKYIVRNQFRNINVHCSINIPTGYKEIRVWGHEEEERYFIFPDSSLIYVSNDATSSFDNDLSINDSLTYIKILSQQSKIFSAIIIEKDSLIRLIPSLKKYHMHGNNSKGLWKNISVGIITYGYQNVPSSKAELFENIINSFEIIKIDIGKYQSIKSPINNP